MAKQKVNFLAALLMVAVAVVLQLKFGSVIGYGHDFVLAALVGAAFFASFSELLVLVFFSIFILNWQPGVSVEMLAIFILPVVTFLGRGALPGKPWFTSVGFLIFSILLFYMAADFNGLLRNFSEVIISAFFGVLFGVLVFHFLRYFYEVREYDW